MELVPCNTCGSTKFKKYLSKESPLGEMFHVVECSDCKLLQVNPQPNLAEVIKYYSNSYFTKRSDRGYDNYYSDKMKSEISRVFTLNLQDLDFFSWEQKFKKPFGEKKTSLDIGCAAGYFVDFMRSRGYEAEGIEVADGPVKFARETLSLKVHQEDFLQWDKTISKKYDVISLWATIEHLHKPKETLEKIKLHLNPGGVLIISTCRFGLLAKLAGIDWRYLNVPEHLYYYSMQGLVSLLKDTGFKNHISISYGSGMTSKSNASWWFRIRKFIFDRLVKYTNSGDMMAIRVMA